MSACHSADLILNAGTAFLPSSPTVPSTWIFVGITCERGYDPKFGALNFLRKKIIITTPYCKCGPVRPAGAESGAIGGRSQSWEPRNYCLRYHGVPLDNFPRNGPLSSCIRRALYCGSRFFFSLRNLLGRCDVDNRYFN